MVNISCDNCGVDIEISIYKAIKYSIVRYLRKPVLPSYYQKELYELQDKYNNLLDRHNDNLQRARDLGDSFRDMAKSYSQIAAVIEKIHSPAVKAKEEHIT